MGSALLPSREVGSLLFFFFFSFLSNVAVVKWSISSVIWLCTGLPYGISADWKGFCVLEQVHSKRCDSFSGVSLHCHQPADCALGVLQPSWQWEKLIWESWSFRLTKQCVLNLKLFKQQGSGIPEHMGNNKVFRLMFCTLTNHRTCFKFCLLVTSSTISVL